MSDVEQLDAGKPKHFKYLRRYSPMVEPSQAGVMQMTEDGEFVQFADVEQLGRRLDHARQELATVVALVEALLPPVEAPPCAETAEMLVNRICLAVNARLADAIRIAETRLDLMTGASS